MTTVEAAGSADALTADGGIVTIRPVLPSDRHALTALYAMATPDDLYLRFFAPPGAEALAAEVERLCQPATDRHLAVLAMEGADLVGVASFDHTDGVAQAEFALYVAATQRGRGIGTLLLEHLAARAHRSGIAELVGEVLPGNTRMLRVARDLSAHAWSRYSDGIVDIGLGVGTDEATQVTVDSRDRIAERASLHALLSPTSVAVVGAGHRPGGIGRETLLALRDYGFAGALYAINRNNSSVDGVAGYRSVKDLPGPVDLLVIAVPADEVPGVLADAGAAGVRGAIVLSSGLGEAGPDGRRRQREVLQLARAHGIRLVGPNCLGVINTDPGVRLDASFAPTTPPSGGLGIAAQSGAVGIALLQNAISTGPGVSTFVSLGNKADVSGNDLIAYWYDDPATKAIALYLESFGNPRKFARTVRALSRRKPVLALKSGRSDAGRRAGASHTAAAAAPAATVDALFAQAGVVRPENLGDLIDAARILTEQPLPTGRRLVIIGNAGGLNVLAADAAEPAGLIVSALSPATHLLIDRATSGAASLDNPVDLGAGASPAAFAAVTAAVADSGEADAVLLVIIATRANAPQDILAALAPVVDAHPGLTVAVTLVGWPDAHPRLGERGAPIYDLPERAVRALGHAAAYAQWRRQPLGRRPELADIDVVRACAEVDRALSTGGGWLPYHQAATILSAYGIPVLSAAHVTTPADAVAVADRVGYPVVLKSADPDLVHKTDTGGVRTGLTDAAAVQAAFPGVAATGRPGSGVLVQKQIDEPVELSAGVVHDPLFGSVVVLGLGGVRAEVFGDRSLRLVPLTDLDAQRMWRELRSAPLLTGFRGAAPVDTAGLEDLLLRLGRLAEDLPEIAELDLNPVLAGPGLVIAVDAKLRLAPVGAEPDPMLRQLRAADSS